jgi:hypothetical protein
MLTALYSKVENLEALVSEGGGTSSSPQAAPKLQLTTKNNGVMKVLKREVQKLCNRWPISQFSDQVVTNTDASSLAPAIQFTPEIKIAVTELTKKNPLGNTVFISSSTVKINLKFNAYIFFNNSSMDASKLQ